MKTNILFVIVCFNLLFSLCSIGQNKKADNARLGWPEISQENKPWSRWWWMGNAVNANDLTSAMETYSKAGLGGLEITPIYGVHGYENRFIDFLSPEWLNVFEHTLSEAKRLGMGIDLAMASGWPFGGLWVKPEDACCYMDIKSYSLSEGEHLKEKIALDQTSLLRSISRKNLKIEDVKFPIGENADSLQTWAIEQIRFPKPMPLTTLIGYSDKGDTLDLLAKVGNNGTLEWAAPTGKWNLYAIFEGWHGKLVERAGPGGEGDVIDHFSAKAIDNYLNHFSEAFDGHDISGLRAYFNDSYEVDDAYGEANFTPKLFDEFLQRRKYDLRKFLPALVGKDVEDINRRVLSDYRETISDLLLENYTQRWHNWALNGGKIIRNQAHGAPANILDLYAAADIPETEGEDIVKIKMASSAAHLAGKKLVSSESATWLKDHFEASLSDVKHAVDLFFLGGINHVFYHGTTFSPQDAPWPGWMFYASVHFGPTNPFWKDFGILNSYIARTQSFLQSGKTANDLLLYYPIADEYAERGKSLLLHFDGSARGSNMQKSARLLFDKGYAFDYISDRQILNLQSENGKLKSLSADYQSILLPKTKLMPVETYEKLISLARNGATILMENLPEDVPGFGNLNERQEKFKKLINSLEFQKEGSIQIAKIGKGKIAVGEVSDLLAFGKIRREPMFDVGLQCVRRNSVGSTIYFIANRGTEKVDGYVPFETKIGSAILFNPMTGAYGKALSKVNNELYLQLAPGESCLVQVFNKKVEAGDYSMFKPIGEANELKNNWQLTFMEGGPTLPHPVNLPKLVSWTELDGDSYKAFSGTAVYQTTFSKPKSNAGLCRIDLGKVAHSARISLNGKEIAALVCAPFRVDIPIAELKAINTLEVSITNLMGNRIADMERKNENFKIFYNVNFPARDAVNRGADGLFTTKNWQPRESGLIGPVTLTPIKKVE